MSDNLFPTRVRYSDRQFLQAADLQADQAYHRQARWRHNLALHSWGILAGLEVSVTGADSSATSVVVTAGMALDGYGRELVVAADRTQRQFLDANQSYDIWLVYGEEPVPKGSPQAPLRAGCAASAEITRVQENPRIRVTKTADRRSPSTSRPDGVPTGDLDFGPERSAPSPDRPWPVFLARLDFRDAGEGRLRWLPNPAERRYAGLVAECVAAPRPSSAAGVEQSRTVLVNGADPDYPDLRFAVASTDGAGARDLEANPPFVAVRMGTDKQSRIELRSDRVTVAGDVILRDGSALQFGANPVTAGNDDPHALALTGADHWRVYHHFSPPDAPADSTLGGSTPLPSFSDELRITMPAVPAGANSVVIGYFGDKGKFEPVLAVRADKSVDVYGTLRVEGEISGRFTKLPAGAATSGGGPLNAAVMRREVEKYLSDRGEFPAVLDPVFAANGGQDAVVDAATKPGALGDGPIKKLLGNFWKDEARKKLVTDWLFQKGEQRAGDLAASVPNTYTAADQPLTAFAKKLWEEPDRVKALVAALLQNVPAVPTAAQVEAVGAIAAGLSSIPGGMKAIGKSLPDADRPDDQATRETAEATLAAKFTPLVEGLLDGGKLRTQALVAALFDHGADSDLVSGKRAVAGALGHKLPAFPNEPDLDASNPATFIPTTARWRAFVAHVLKVVQIGEALAAIPFGTSEEPMLKEYTQLKKAIKRVTQIIT